MLSWLFTIGLGILLFYAMRRFLVRLYGLYQALSARAKEREEAEAARDRARPNAKKMKKYRGGEYVTYEEVKE